MTEPMRWPALNPRPQCQPRIVAHLDRVGLWRERRLLIDREQLARYLGLRPDQILTFKDAGRLPLPIRLGRTVRWSVAEVREWVEAGWPPIGQWMKQRGYSGDQQHW